MKFKDIKKGDIVYIVKGVKVGMFSAPTLFWVPKPVERVTPKQFAVDGQCYKKENGLGVGMSAGPAYYLGDNLGFEGKVTDQTKAMLSFIEKINMSRQISNTTDKLKEVNHKHPRLEEIYDAMVKIEGLLGSEEE